MRISMLLSQEGYIKLTTAWTPQPAPVVSLPLNSPHRLPHRLNPFPFDVPYVTESNTSGSFQITKYARRAQTQMKCISGRSFWMIVLDFDGVLWVCSGGVEPGTPPCTCSWEIRADNESLPPPMPPTFIPANGSKSGWVPDVLGGASPGPPCPAINACINCLCWSSDHIEGSGWDLFTSGSDEAAVWDGVRDFVGREDSSPVKLDDIAGTGGSMYTLWATEV